MLVALGEPGGGDGTAGSATAGSGCLDTRLPGGRRELDLLDFGRGFVSLAFDWGLVSPDFLLDFAMYPSGLSSLTEACSSLGFNTALTLKAPLQPTGKMTKQAKTYTSLIGNHLLTGNVIHWRMGLRLDHGLRRAGNRGGCRFLFIVLNIGFGVTPLFIRLQWLVDLHHAEAEPAKYEENLADCFSHLGQLPELTVPCLEITELLKTPRSRREGLHGVGHSEKGVLGSVRVTEATKNRRDNLPAS